MNIRFDTLRHGASFWFKELTTDLKQDSPNFYRIKRLTNGMLSADVYNAIYERAIQASEGNMLDIGTGRGAGTISIALAIKASKKHSRVYAIDQFYQHTAAHPHKYTMSTHPHDCIDLNLGSFMDNMKKYQVDDLVIAIAGKTTDAGDQIPNTRDYTLMSLDVDGYIDRDFRIFYNRLAPGARIIIDDCRDVIDRHGRANITTYRQLTTAEKHKFLEEKPDFFMGRILGKQYLIYRLVEHFIANGLLETDTIVESTFFGIKPNSINGNVEFDETELESIRNEILDDFIRIAQ